MRCLSHREIALTGPASAHHWVIGIGLSGLAAPFGSIAVHRGRGLIWYMLRTRKRHRYETTLRVRNVVVAGHRTSVRLEPLMWDSLQEIAMEQGMNVNQLVTQIKRSAGRSSLTSAIRVYIVDFYRSRAR